MMGSGPRTHKMSTGDCGGMPLSAMLSAPLGNVNMTSLGVNVGNFPPLNHTASLPNVNQVGGHPNGAHPAAPGSGPGPGPGPGPGQMQQSAYMQFGAPQSAVNNIMQTGLTVSTTYALSRSSLCISFSLLFF